MTDSFSQIMFTSNATAFVCPRWTGGPRYLCPAPRVCATGSSGLKQYCCNPESDGNVCWTPPSVCGGDGSTFTCNIGGYSWCCLQGKEICTQLSGQVNICYSTGKNPLSNLSQSVLNKTYSSLSSAQPSASSYTFDPATLIEQTVPTSKQSASATSSSVSSTSSPNPPSHQLSGGAIAGIVIGCLAAIASIGLAAALLLRSRKKKQQNSSNGLASSQDKLPPVEDHQTHMNYGPQEVHAISMKPAELPGHGMEARYGKCSK